MLHELWYHHVQSSHKEKNLDTKPFHLILECYQDTMKALKTFFWEETLSGEGQVLKGDFLKAPSVGGLPVFPLGEI